jgi:riboflavin kinase/FMN adenylyltransferase
VHGLAGGPREGVASVGMRPTVKENGKPLLEVLILDFGDTIYGRRITVEFLHKLRDEARFADLVALARQIDADVTEAREYFAARG